MVKEGVVVLSGGLDSTAALYQAIREGMIVTSCVSFNYGQKHKKELDYAKATCERLAIKHHVIDLWSSGFTEAIATSGSSLVSDTEVPEGHYAQENMKSTVVPNRNMVMISIAGSIAVAEGVGNVVVGVHAGDHFIYPDCRYPFIVTMDAALRVGNEGFGDIHLVAPFINSTKADIAYSAMLNMLHLDHTWSCYKGGDKHCGKCGTCVERLEAFHEALERFKISHPHVPIDLVEDKTVYEDSQYWLEATK